MAFHAAIDQQRGIQQVRFVFASLRLKGKKPMKPDNLLKRYIRPALERAGVVGEDNRGVAQLPSLAGDEPAGDGSGREGGAGIVAARERQDDARHLQARSFAAKARCRRVRPKYFSTLAGGSGLVSC